jgi:hypothetical protein
VSVAEREKESAAEKATQAVLAAQTRIEDMRWLMSDPRGRRFVWRQLEESGIYRSSYSNDALAMAFNEGERNRGLKLLDEISRHCPKGLSEMQKEARAHERRNNRSTSSSPDA